jgi:hypothetical protein
MNGVWGSARYGRCGMPRGGMPFCRSRMFMVMPLPMIMSPGPLALFAGTEPGRRDLHVRGGARRHAGQRPAAVARRGDIDGIGAVEAAGDHCMRSGGGGAEFAHRVDGYGAARALDVALRAGLLPRRGEIGIHQFVTGRIDTLPHRARRQMAALEFGLELPQAGFSLRHVERQRGRKDGRKGSNGEKRTGSEHGKVSHEGTPLRARMKSLTPDPRGATRGAGKAAICGLSGACKIR